MHTKRIKKKSGVYLARYESFREDGKVKTRFLGYDGKEGPVRGVPLPKKSLHGEKPLYPEISKRAGDVKLMWTIANDRLNMPKIIDKICCGNENIDGKSPGKILTAWAVNKATYPESAANLSEWVKTTILPELTGLPDDYFTDSAFYTSLDRVCYKDNTADGYTDHSPIICNELFHHWRNHNPLPPSIPDILAYDLTAILIFGNAEDLGARGYNSKNANQKQINLCVLVSKWDNIPVSYFLIPGNFNSMSSVKDLLVTVIGASIQPGTLIWDRGNTSEESIRDIEKLGWKLICGVQQVPKEVGALIRETDVPMGVPNRVKSTEKSALYATRAIGELYGRQNAGVVYINLSKRMELIDARNELLADLSDELDALRDNPDTLNEMRMKTKISEIIGENSKFFTIEITHTGSQVSLNWTFNDEAIVEAVAFDGKHLLYSTDTSLKAIEVVREYVGKDFIERSFKTLKTNLRIAPVRHWKNHRIRGIFFVNMMALWIRKVYDLSLNQLEDKKRPFGFDELLKQLKLVSYVEVESETGEKAYWYLNLSNAVIKQLKWMGFKNLFEIKRLNQL